MPLKRLSKYKVLAFFAIAALAFTSCKSRKALMTAYEVKPMSTDKIIRKVAREAPDYKTYESKRISVIYENKGDKNMFSGQFKIKHDERTLLTMRKLNMPIARCMVTRDSFKLVNYMDKSYIVDELERIQQVFGIDLEYELLQAMLTADVSGLLDDESLDKELNSRIDENMYRIDSELSNKISKAIIKGNQKRLNRYMSRLDNNEFVKYTVWVDPQFFVIRKLAFNNIKTNEDLIISYDQFEVVGRSLFPQDINLKFNSPESEMALSIKLTKPSVNKEKDFSFSIPDKYERYKLVKN